MKKIIILSDANNPHTIKWVTGIASKDFFVYIFSLAKCNHSLYDTFQNIRVIDFNFEINTNTKFEGSIKKLFYLRVLTSLKKLIDEVNPDILHAHYASSYGLLGALTNFHPFILSVWGNDVYEFPKKSFLHKTILKYNLKHADILLSTSNVMAHETNQYTTKKIIVTPFGIDLNTFKPLKVKSLFQESDIVIGTIKTLEEKYGIEYLIKSFKILKNKYPKLPLKLLIVGKGSLEASLKNLVNQLSIENDTIFTGRINYSEIPIYHNMLDISVFLSIRDSESFGVAILEASACEKPVIVSNVGGLPEVVKNEITGLIVSPRSEKETSEAIEKLLLNENLRKEIGKEGRKHVREKYDWNDNLDHMMKIYNEVLNNE